MRSRTILAALAVFFAGITLAFAADANMGTWKLNEAKSKIAAGSPKNTTVVYAPAGDSIKVTVDGVLGDGKPSHNEWTGKFDGKDYPIVGDPNADSRAYTKVDDNTMTLVNKKAGKVTVTGKIILAADGKSRVLSTSGADASGKVINSTFVYDKQ
jgi:hypothetical protein